MFRLKIYLILFLFFSKIYTSDQIPGIAQNKPILLKGGVLHTIESGTLYNVDLLFDNGVIQKIGNEVITPDNTEIINIKGKHVYPGLISACSTLGLQEIGSIRATRDYAEVGSINPNVRANVSYNPDSELIPISRSNGILASLVVPRSGLISGQSSLMILDGWTWEDATFRHPIGIHIFWPRLKFSKEKLRTNKKDSKKNLIQNIDNYFSETLAYSKIKQKNDLTFKHDLKLDAMEQVVLGELPLFVHANEISQIESAVYWAKRQNIKIIIVGGKDSWRLAGLLKENNIPVIYTQTFSTPGRRYESFDQSYKTPSILFEEGVKFCISNSESPFQTPHIRNLPYYAAKAASYGLPWDEALRSITLSTAEILGVQKRIGSLSIGKDATLFISDGDILDVRTNVEMAFINGRSVDLSDHHKDLYYKYQKKYDIK